MKGPSRSRLDDLLEYLHLNEMTKSPLCQEKSAFGDLITVIDCGLER